MNTTPVDNVDSDTQCLFANLPHRKVGDDTLHRAMAAASNDGTVTIEHIIGATVSTMESLHHQ